MDLKSLIRHARGDEPADLLLRNGRVVNVLSGQVDETSVALAGEFIVGLGDYRARAEVDLAGAYVAPGFIDAHVHIESALVPPAEFARAVVPRGTTTVITDPHEIANVLGLEGIRFMFESAKFGPLNMYVMASSCVPATAMATSGAVLHGYDLFPLKSDPWVLGLAEVMNFNGVIGGDDAVLEKIGAFQGDVIDGHSPGLSGVGLQAYVAAGVQSDHESTTAEEALEKLRLGMMVMIREGTVARDLASLVPIVTPANQHRFCFCTDDCQPADLLTRGGIDHAIRSAIALGMHPVSAIRLATWNPAQHFRLHQLGAVTPGRRADLVVFDDLRAPRPRLVFRNGALMARDGHMVVPPRPPSRTLRSTMNVAWESVDFRIPATGRRARVIGAMTDCLLTAALVDTPLCRDGLATADPSRDLLKVAVIERHMASGAMGKGLVRGLGLREGALASSVAHDHHNLIVAGADDLSMMTAARRVGALHGGMVVASGERVLAEVPLPLGGLMSAEPVEAVKAQVEAAVSAARALGSPLHDPFMAMSFLSLEVIPALKVTDKGLIDVARQAVVPLWIGEDARP
jgi:adenine deaminase